MVDLESTSVRSHRLNTGLLKLWAPCLWLAAAALFASGGPFRWRLALAVPPLGLAAFYLSLAVVQLNNGVLRYRRFLDWTTLDRDDVVSSGRALHPLVGYMRLKRFLLPWGRLYFVLDPSLDPNPFHRGDYTLLRHLKGQPAPPADRAANDSSLGPRLLTAALLGSVLSFLLLRLSGRQPLPVNPQSRWTALPVTLRDLLGSPWVTMALCVVFFVLAAYRCHRPQALTYAFVAGGSLAWLLFRYVG